MTDELTVKVARAICAADSRTDVIRARIHARAAIAAVREAEADEIDRLRAALAGLLDALDAVDREAERADQPGATAWSSAPVVALQYKRQEARAALQETDR